MMNILSFVSLSLQNQPKQIQYMEETVSRIQRRNTARVDVQATYHKLNAFIEKVNEKILNRIQLVQQVFLEDYKAQVKQMTDELKSIRAVLDEQLLKQRANQRLFFLEEQRDFFRGQTTKLNEQLTALSKQNAKIKLKIEQVISQAANYKQLVYSLQKKIAKVQNQAFQLERLKKSTSKMPAISNEKETASMSPTKTTFTRYSPLMSYPQTRPLFRSVQLKNTSSKEGFDGELKRRDQILDDCIKDLKKKIFYRTAGGKQSQRFYFDEEKVIPFEKFTRTDKQELIRSILSRDDLLGQFYKFMVGRKAEEKLALKSTIANKSHFSDKIFKIKLCGLENLSTN